MYDSYPTLFLKNATPTPVREASPRPAAHCREATQGRLSRHLPSQVAGLHPAPCLGNQDLRRSGRAKHPQAVAILSRPSTLRVCPLFLLCQVTQFRKDELGRSFSNRLETASGNTFGSNFQLAVNIHELGWISCILVFFFCATGNLKWHFRSYHLKISVRLFAHAYLVDLRANGTGVKRRERLFQSRHVQASSAGVGLCRSRAGSNGSICHRSVQTLETAPVRKAMCLRTEFPTGSGACVTRALHTKCLAKGR